MPTSLTLRFSHIARPCLMSSHAEPFYISFAALFPFYWEGIFPQVSISYTCILALNIGMFHCLELVFLPIMTLISSSSVTIKQFYSFSRFLNIWKSPKKSKNQKAGQGKMLSLVAVESCRLRTEHCISYPLVGFIV